MENNNTPVQQDLNEILRVRREKLAELQETAGKKKNLLSDNETLDDDYVAEILLNTAPDGLDEGKCEAEENSPNNPQKMVKLTPRELFDILYDSYAKLKWKQKRKYLENFRQGYSKRKTRC